MYFKPVSISSAARPLMNLEAFSLLIESNSGVIGPSYLISSNFCLANEILWLKIVSITSWERFLENNINNRNSDLTWSPKFPDLK